MTEHVLRRRAFVRHGVRAFPQLCLLLILGCCMAGRVVRGQGLPAGHPPSHGHARHQPELPGFDEPTSINVPDITLTNQDNRQVKLYRDLMKGKLVVLNFFYTTCEGVCPTAGHWLSRLQDRLGGRLGKDVIILSVTIDPETDTPEKLSRWGEYWKRRPGWTLLTSRSQSLRDLMREFKPYPDRGIHAPTVFVGDGTQNPVAWVALDMLAEGDLLLNYLEAKGRGGAGKE